MDKIKAQTPRRKGNITLAHGRKLLIMLTIESQVVGMHLLMLQFY